MKENLIYLLKDEEDRLRNLSEDADKLACYYSACGKAWLAYDLGVITLEELNNYLDQYAEVTI